MDVYSWHIRQLGDPSPATFGGSNRRARCQRLPWLQNWVGSIDSDSASVSLPNSIIDSEPTPMSYSLAKSSLTTFRSFSYIFTLWVVSQTMEACSTLENWRSQHFGTTRKSLLFSILRCTQLCSGWPVSLCFQPRGLLAVLPTTLAFLHRLRSCLCLLSGWWFPSFPWTSQLLSWQDLTIPATHLVWDFPHQA